MPRYAVLAANHDQAEVFNTLPDAVAYRDAWKDDAFSVFAMRELPESEMWDWALRPASSDEAPRATYVNERAARNSCYDGMELVKRRAGTSEWVAGDAQ